MSFNLSLSTVYYITMTTPTQDLPPPPSSIQARLYTSIQRQVLKFAAPKMLEAERSRINEFERPAGRSSSWLGAKRGHTRMSNSFLKTRWVPKVVNSLPSDLGLNNHTITERSRDEHEEVQDNVVVDQEKISYNQVYWNYDKDNNSGQISRDSFESDESNEEGGENKRLVDEFIEKLSSMCMGKILDQTIQWYCPACRGGPDATRMYNGLHPLVAHVTAHGKTRSNLHRELAQVLGKMLPKTPIERVSDKWKTFQVVNKYAEIVWPPMVVIVNTCFRLDVNHEWNGMPNKDLVKHFGAYSPVKALKCYVPQEHCGLSILIFESSTNGYLEAKRLHKHFKAEERGRVHWKSHSIANEKPQLYGYLAVMEDLHMFNQSYRGNNKLEYEMRSYQQMVMDPLKQIDSLELRVVEEQNRADALALKYDMRNREVEIIRERSKLQQEQNQEQVEFLEGFLEERINEEKDLKRQILELTTELSIMKLKETVKKIASKIEVNCIINVFRLGRSEPLCKVWEIIRPDPMEAALVFSIC
ncbi:hypothetical protein ACFE04_025693 [Oxalis oulophora]